MRQESEFRGIFIFSSSNTESDIIGIKFHEWSFSIKEQSQLNDQAGITEQQFA